MQLPAFEASKGTMRTLYACSAECPSACPRLILLSDQHLNLVTSNKSTMMMLVLAAGADELSACNGGDDNCYDGK